MKEKEQEKTYIIMKNYKAPASLYKTGENTIRVFRI